MTDILTALAAPFPPDAISWRVGSTNKDKTKGMALAYIDARDVQDRLDAVCGLGWQVRHPWSVGTKLACEIGILVNGEWLWRGDGAGDSDVEAEKGAFSDSFKRSAVRWGIGRYLYDLDSPWVAIEPMGRSYKIAEGERAKLRALLARGAPTAAPKPETHQASAEGQQKRPPRNEEFFRGRSYEITPATAGGTLQRWEQSYRSTIAACRNLDELGKVEMDNAVWFTKFCDKARPEVVEDLRQLVMKTVDRLKVGIAA